MKKMHLLIFLISTFLGLSCSTENNQDNEFEMNNQTQQITGNTFTYLALGDSYAIGEKVEVSERFPVQLANKLNEAKFRVSPPTIVARTGWTTSELANGIKMATLNESYQLVTLLIGVNNQYRGLSENEYRIEFKELLNTAVRFAGNKTKNVIVISIPDYGVTPFALNRNPQKIREEIDAFNQINKEEALLAGVNYVDITSISRQAKTNPELIATDGLHPSGDMYRLWVEAILPAAKQILENQ